MKTTIKIDEEWQAQEDARTLERYQEIIKDKKRLDAALKAASKTVDNLEARAKALSKSLTGIKTQIKNNGKNS